MLKKIKQFAGVLLILFLVVSLFVAILAIWNVIDNELAKEILTKVTYTFGAIFAVSLAIIYITKTKE